MRQRQRAALTGHLETNLYKRLVKMVVKSRQQFSWSNFIHFCGKSSSRVGCQQQHLSTEWKLAERWPGHHSPTSPKCPAQYNSASDDLFERNFNFNSNSQH